MKDELFVLCFCNLTFSDCFGCQPVFYPSEKGMCYPLSLGLDCVTCSDSLCFDLSMARSVSLVVGTFHSIGHMLKLYEEWYCLVLVSSRVNKKAASSEHVLLWTEKFPNLQYTQLIRMITSWCAQVPLLWQLQHKDKQQTTLHCFLLYFFGLYKFTV